MLFLFGLLFISLMFDCLCLVCVVVFDLWLHLCLLVSALLSVVVFVCVLRFWFCL